MYSTYYMHFRPTNAPHYASGSPASQAPQRVSRAPARYHYLGTYYICHRCPPTCHPSTDRLTTVAAQSHEKWGTRAIYRAGAVTPSGVASCWRKWMRGRRWGKTAGPCLTANLLGWDRAGHHALTWPRHADSTRTRGRAIREISRGKGEGKGLSTLGR